jgi:hypothetical protein
MIGHAWLFPRQENSQPQTTGKITAGNCLTSGAAGEEDCRALLPTSVGIEHGIGGRPLPWCFNSGH